jgi:hypothetical protein
MGAEVLTSYTRWFECVTGSDGLAFGHLCFLFLSEIACALCFCASLVRKLQWTLPVGADSDITARSVVAATTLEEAIAACISISEGKLAWEET